MISHLEKFISKYGRLPTEVDPDYLEMLRMSKFIILDAPELNPAKCANCGGTKVDGRKYIDFGLYVDWYGTVYLCGHCIKELATNMGLINQEETKVEEDLLPQLKEVAEESINKLKEVLDGFYGYYEKLKTDNEERFDGDDNQSNRDNDSSNMGYSSDDSSLSTTDKSGIDKTKQRVTESPSSTGRENIRSLTELLRDP